MKDMLIIKATQLGDKFPSYEVIYNADFRPLVDGVGVCLDERRLFETWLHTASYIVNGKIS